VLLTVKRSYARIGKSDSLKNRHQPGKCEHLQGKVYAHLAVIQRREKVVEMALTQSRAQLIEVGQGGECALIVEEATQQVS
jgi:hypothetical protein